MRLAVIAHVRHRETVYDDLLAKGRERSEARATVEEAVCRVLQNWETARLPSPGRSRLLRTT